MVVGQVVSDSPAGELGIQPGDVIVSVDQEPVTTPEGAAAQLKGGGLNTATCCCCSIAVRRANSLASRSAITGPRAVPLSPATITCRVTSRRVSVRRHWAGIPRRHPRKRAGGRPR